MSDTTTPTLEQYVHNYEAKEQAIQSALENSQIKLGDRIVTLEDALLELAQSYGTSTKESLARTQLVVNTYTMLKQFRENIFSTTDQRNARIQKAREIQGKTKQQIIDEAWEKDVLAKARTERDLAQKAEE